MQYCCINPKLFGDSGGLELRFWRGICDICRLESSNQKHGDAHHSSFVHSTFLSTAFIKDLKWDKLCSLVETKTAGSIRYFKFIYLAIYQRFYMKGWWTERVLKWALCLCWFEAGGFIDYLTGFKVAEDFPFSCIFSQCFLQVSKCTPVTSSINLKQTCLASKSAARRAKLQTPFKCKECCFYAAVPLRSNENN